MGHELFAKVQSRVCRSIEEDFGLPRLYSAGALFTRIWADDKVPADEMDVDPGHKYDSPHVDKANRASYDYSALLYLNSHCEEEEAWRREGRRCAYDAGLEGDFGGGRFAWLDEEEDVVVEPRGGRLLAFTGGLENLHQVRKVTRGTRYVIGMWFTCHRELEYKDEAAGEDVVEQAAEALVSGAGGGGGGVEVGGIGVWEAAACAAAARDAQEEQPPQVPPRRHAPPSSMAWPRITAQAGVDVAPEGSLRQRLERADVRQRVCAENDAAEKCAPLPARRVGGGWRGFGVPGHPDGVPSPGEDGYVGRWGVDDSSTMKASFMAYEAALVAYDTEHGPPMGAAADEDRLKRQRARGLGFEPLYPEDERGHDLYADGESAWQALTEERNVM